MLKTLLEGYFLSTINILEFSPLKMEDGTILIESAGSKPDFLTMCRPLS